MTWTCQEGSGSLLGNLDSFFCVDRLVSFVVGQLDFLGTGETFQIWNPALLLADARIPEDTDPAAQPPL